MAIDLFLKIDGIKGESTDSKHKDEVELLSFEHSLVNQSKVGSGTSGSGAGKPVFGALNLVARTNLASPTLFQAAATGDHFKKAVLTVRKSGKGQQEYHTIELGEVYVSSFSNGYMPVEGKEEEVEHVDRIGLSYKTIKLSYKPQSADGAMGAPAIGQFNLGTNNTLV